MRSAEVGLLLGMSDSAHDAVLKVVGLVNHVLIGIVVRAEAARRCGVGCGPRKAQPVSLRRCATGWRACGTGWR